MEFKLDKGTGYMYCHAPDHFTANKAGKVMEHVYVMSMHIGRKLEKNECVHHIDRDRTNNDISNLVLMTISEHARLHAFEDRGVYFIPEDRVCKNCNNVYQCHPDSDRSYCSSKCFSDNNIKFNISKEDLLVMVWEMPTTKVAEILGVSDVAVAKRCKKFGIPKPPRGYWEKLKAGKIQK